MALTTEEVRKIASLARLRFTAAEEAAIAGQLGKIVDYIDQLQRFEAGPAAATATGAGAATPAPAGPPTALTPVDAMPPLPPVPKAPAIAPRAAPEADDLALPCLPRESFLANAPASLDGFLLVPAVKAGQVSEAKPGVDE